MAYYAGIDIGRLSTKVVITNEGAIVSHHVMPSRRGAGSTGEEALEEALKKAGLSREDLSAMTVTGYGAYNFDLSNHQVSEIKCQARGVGRLFPSVRTVIDIGGQATKYLRVSGGRVTEFWENQRCGLGVVVVAEGRERCEKCGAGSARLFRVVAGVLRVPFKDVAELASQSKNAADFRTGCAVVCRDEAVSWLEKGEANQDILAGLNHAIARRISHTLKRIILERDCAITGGGAKYPGLIKAQEEELGIPLLVPEEPLITAAFGAALIAQEEPQVVMVPEIVGVDDDDEW